MSTETSRLPLENFTSLYQSLTPGNVSRQQLAGVYSEKVEFSDPMHRIQGLNQLTDYFQGLYSNLKSIDFDFHRTMTRDGETIAHWTMTFSHPQLYRGNRTITVEGISLLTWENDLIIRHQDIFDAGALLYEHLPVLGWVIRKLKERMA